MAMRPAKIALWVNSAHIGVYCVFAQLGYDDIMQLEYHLTLIEKE